jgi:hypothetical protein
MAHESFESEAIAAQMSRDFVCIKVDREERPDLDTIYQQALALLGQQGGWPLTMFLTPDGEPFWGGTYFPPEARWGRAGLPDVLREIARLWREERGRLEGNRDALGAALERLARPQGGELPDPGLALETARLLAEQFDTIHGGLAGAPKFPQAPVLDLLWRAGLAGGSPALRRRVLHTLSRICQGGICDHLGGGFARYSVDAFWLVPHFEKMLYDNAQLLRLLGEAWAATGEPLFRARAGETVTWLRREMMVGDAFASSLDADSEGEEGRFYVWRAEEIEALLGIDATAFKLAYGVTGAGNWEGRSILNRLHEPGLPDDFEEALLARCRALLLEARERRARPARDDKVLADWNGLMIAALADAGARLGEPGWIGLAERAFAWIVEHLGQGDRLRHSWRQGRCLPLALLDDYAQMSLAAVTLHERTGRAGYLERAERWIGTLDREHADPAGGYLTSGRDASDLIVRAKTAQDGPLPSGNAALLHALARLAAITGDPAHERRAQGILRAFAGELRRMPTAFAGLLSGLLLLAEPVQVVIVGAPGREALLRAVGEAATANTVVNPIADGERLHDRHPASGKPMVDGRATAYICVGRACRAPLTEPEALRRELLQLGEPA